MLHLPYAQFLLADGTPKAAKDIGCALDKAGVSRYTKISVFADTLGDAPVNGASFRTMGLADAKVWAP